MSKRILLTGGAGYIGSHTYLALIGAGYDVVILDDFSNAKPSVLDRLAVLSGQNRVKCHNGSILDRPFLDSVFAQYEFDAVIHFAAFKSVAESSAKPLDYFETNVGGMVNLLQSMKAANVWSLVFSSSATVYGDPDQLPIPETATRSYTNPYGYTKLAGEQILEQTQQTDDPWAIGILRYFNPVGAHPSGMIGEDPNDIPNNLMPYIAKVAAGELPFLQVFGDDYDTPDGTGVRDYIHVDDLAKGHVQSLDALLSSGDSHTVNLGTGNGYSVLDMLRAYEKACGHTLNYKIADRRTGDIASCYADAGKARDLLGFSAQHTLDQMCESSWHWMTTGARNS